ncbi:MAG TPA: DUF58 domain-containing protein [Anaerolineaceae bacterium]|nr:DUF58 domain-containing protein [Anaerolineaceae bacterium]
MIIRRPFWGIILILIGAGLAAFLLPPLAPNFPPQSISIPYRLIYIAILLIVISWIWAYISIRGLTLKRTARGFRQQLGEVFEERFEVVNKFGIVRLWLEIRDQSNLPGANGSRVFSWIGGREQRTYTSYTLLSQRGEYNLGPTILYSGDPFGLFAFQKSFSNSNTILVMPYFVELSEFPFPPGLLTGGRALRRKSPETTPQSAGVREYAPGDPLSRIHWPSTARKDRFMVKEFDQDPQADVWIFLDAYKLAHFSSLETVAVPKVDKFWLWKQKFVFTLPTSTFEYATSVAASVARYFIKQGQAVGFVSAGQMHTAIPAERGDRQTNKILETLAFLREEGELPLLGLINAQMSNIPRGSVAVLITASNDDSIAAAADSLAQRKIKPVVILIDSVTFGGTNDVNGLAATLVKMKIPVAVVHKGDDLKNILEKGFIG